jgi:hypothetical protein
MYYGEYMNWQREEVTLFTFITRLPVIASGFVGVTLCIVSVIVWVFLEFDEWASSIVFWDRERFDKKSKGGK